jgi:FMN phosphatase YigB (HAD superfamily)
MRSSDMPPPAYIFVDVAGTLVHKPGIAPAFQGVLRSAGVEVDDAHLLATHKRWTEAVKFPMQTSAAFYREFNAEVLRALGAEPTPLRLDALGRACAGLPWEAFDDVAALQGLPLPLGVISNWDARLREQLTAIVPLQFSPIIGSAEAGVEKPDLQIYRRALAQVPVDPEHIAFIGDSPFLDVEPARGHARCVAGPF